MMEESWKKLHSLVLAQFRLHRELSPHSPDHWDRVARYGLLLCGETGADVEVVRLFAMLHDSQRREDRPEPEHGPRAAEFVRQLCGEAFALSPGQLELLITSCRDHELGLTSSDPTIGTCWDADRLDLDRIGIVTDSRYMSTDYGRRLACLRPRQRRDLAGIIE